MINKEKTYLVAGLGVSGKGAVELFKKEGIEFVLYDSDDSINKEEIIKELDINPEIKFICGEISESDFSEIEGVIISPGISLDASVVEMAKGLGLPIIGEIELAYEFAKGRLVAITGTNGKTTTTALVGEILRCQFEGTVVAGNIGKSYAKVAGETTDESVVVAEISSFQLETIEEFKPGISAILNITPDHLNRHITMENYSKIKMDIAKNQTENDVCVLNYEDDFLREAGKEIKPEAIYFSCKREMEYGAFYRGNQIIYKENGIETLICTSDEVKLLGLHNVENIMAAVIIAVKMGIPFDVISKAVKAFKGVEHRLEFVADIDGVLYYNDSKGTNVDSTIKAIEAMSGRVILIAGGYDKNVDFDELIKSFGRTVRYMIVFGETATKLTEAANKFGFSNISEVLNLKEAVDVAAKNAKNGETVLFSPACASWDMYKNFEQRGEHFKRVVNEL